MFKKKLDFETMLIWTAVGSAAVLFVVQAVLSLDEARPYLSKVDRFEGERISTQMPMYAEKPLTIREDSTVGKYFALPREKKTLAVHWIHPADARDAVLMINGRPAGNFGRGDLRVDVYDGDYVEIDTGSVKGPVQFVVHTPGDSVISPVDGLVVDAEGPNAVIGKVKFKK